MSGIDPKQQRLGLQWPHRSSRLLYVYDDGEPIPKFAPLCEPEPRALVELRQFGTERGKPLDRQSNLLIRGDNLLAVKTLTRYYSGKVKLIYIDPPFNTGMAFKEYSDGLEHSTWLTMMRDRLELLRKLLAPTGSIWCEIDDTQVGYLNVLMDEIFGRPNRIATVTIKRSAGTGHKAINPGPINVTDFLFGYAKNRQRWMYKPQLVLRQEYDKQYSQFIHNIDQPPSRWRFASLADVTAKDLGFASAAMARKKMGTPAFNKARTEYALSNAKHVVRLALPNYEGISKAARELVDRSRADPEKVFLLPRPNHPDMYFFNGQRILFLIDKVQDEDGEGPALAEKLTNFWDDIAWQGIAQEGGVKFAKNKKPEKLLRRIIALSTNPGDLVLDSFAGSGTTGAVAHKMRRRWIMVEMGAHAETQAVKRLKSVVEGKDPTGVTKIEAWQGGGGFRYLTLAAPLVTNEPTFGLPMLNPEYENGLLVAAVCLREGFTPTGDEWVHGVGGSGTYAHVTETFVTDDYLDLLLEQSVDVIGDSGSLTVYCLNYSSDVTRRERLRIRRVPSDLTAAFCELPSEE